MCPTVRMCVMVILSVLWGHSSRARRLVCLHGIICRCNVTRCPSRRAHCTSSERQKEAWPGLTGPPTVPGALVELRFHAPVICSIRVSMAGPFGAAHPDLFSSLQTFPEHGQCMNVILMDLAKCWL